MWLATGVRQELPIYLAATSDSARHGWSINDAHRMSDAESGAFAADEVSFKLNLRRNIIILIEITTAWVMN